jgi:hypothetical protein
MEEIIKKEILITEMTGKEKISIKEKEDNLMVKEDNLMEKEDNSMEKEGEVATEEEVVLIIETMMIEEKG